LSVVLSIRPPPPSPPFPYTTLFRSADARATYKDSCARCHKDDGAGGTFEEQGLKPLKVPSLRSDHAVKRTDAQIAKQIQNGGDGDRKSTRLNSSHLVISYAVFCLKK